MFEAPYLFKTVPTLFLNPYITYIIQLAPKTFYIINLSCQICHIVKYFLIKDYIILFSKVIERVMMSNVPRILFNSYK